MQEEAIRLLSVFIIVTIGAQGDVASADGRIADVRSARTICPLNAQSDCNGMCFDATKKRCIAGTLCEPYQDAVCQGKCFSSLEQQCLGGRLRRRSAGPSHSPGAGP